LLNRLRLCLARTRLREIQRSPGLFKTGAATGGVCRDRTAAGLL
jgi:hypothetical protein